MNKSITIIIALLVVVFGASYLISNGNDASNGSKRSPTSQTQESPASGKSVDLSGQQLTAIPESVLNQTDITELNLSNNQLTSLPSGIAKLTNLEVLNVENNRLESLPPEISQLRRLREILANNNRLKGLPTELGVMTWLQSLDVSGNNVPGSDLQQLREKLPNTAVKG